MLLYFLRHGPAGDPEEWAGPDDERPLTPEGVERMKREAVTMARLGVKPDVIVSSPLTRALQTAQIVAERLGASERLTIDDRVGPGFSIRRLERIVSEHEGVAQATGRVGPIGSGAPTGSVAPPVEAVVPAGRGVASGSGAARLMLVGHEPSLSQVVGGLIGGARVALKKGGLACVEVPGGDWHSAELLWLASPKLLGS